MTTETNGAYQRRFDLSRGAEESRERTAATPGIIDVKKAGLTVRTSGTKDVLAGYGYNKMESVVGLTPESTDALDLIFSDKGFDPRALSLLAENDSLGDAFSAFVLRAAIPELQVGIDKTYKDRDSRGGDRYSYDGSDGDNIAIDAAIRDQVGVVKEPRTQREKANKGATPLFKIDNFRIPDILADTPIVIVGAGPAGTLSGAALRSVGFNNLTVLDRAREYGGLWNRRPVANGSRNNPFPIDFLGTVLERAPGPGDAITEFLQKIAKKYELPEILQCSVEETYPGDLNQEIVVRRGKESHMIRATIVINGIGGGGPLEPSREGYMKTDVKGSEAGKRWQQQITPEQAEEYRDKHLVFVGFGNSTAEVLVSLAQYNKQGFNIGYSVLSHMPREAIANPRGTVVENGRSYKVYREPAEPVLTKLAGDLYEISSVYNEALKSGSIFPEIVEWQRRGDAIEATDRRGVRHVIPCEELFTLIGYGHSAEQLAKMGVVVGDQYKGTIFNDYDGEIQRNPGAFGRYRVHAGYFGLGSLLRKSSDPNAEVIPGIQHRLYDLLFTAIVRAAEYQVKDHQTRFQAL